MIAQEKIVALAAELTRLGKMPKGWEFSGPTFSDGRQTYWATLSGPMALAALSGVATELIADAGYYIVKSGNDYDDCDGDGTPIWTEWLWEVIAHDWMCGNTLIGQFATSHEALIAALKQIETKEVGE